MKLFKLLKCAWDLQAFIELQFLFTHKIPMCQLKLSKQISGYGKLSIHGLSYLNLIALVVSLAKSLPTTSKQESSVI